MDTVLAKHHAFFALLIIGVLSWMLSIPLDTKAFDDETTHPAITGASVPASNLDKTLKMSLGLADGISTAISTAAKSQSINLWIQEGSKAEDSPSCRAGSW